MSGTCRSFLQRIFGVVAKSIIYNIRSRSAPTGLGMVGQHTVSERVETYVILSRNSDPYTAVSSRTTRSMRLCCMYRQKRISSVWIKMSDLKTKQRNRWNEATMAFTMLKAKIFNPDAETFRTRTPSSDRGICLQVGRIRDPDPRIRWSVSARFFHQSNAKDKRNQLWEGGEGGYGAASHPGRVLH